LEAPFIIDNSKFFSGALSAMSAMILLELPHINILSKVDLIKDDYSKKQLKKFLNPDPLLLSKQNDDFNPKFSKLNKLIANLVDDFGMVQFLPLDCKKESTSVATIWVISMTSPSGVRVKNQKNHTTRTKARKLILIMNKWLS